MNAARFEAWPELLAAELSAARKRPFAWGTHDCCAFAARMTLALTGTDFMAGFPAYDNEADARAILQAHVGVRGIATRCLGEPIPALQAQRGDVVLLSQPTGEILGICAGAVIACPGLTGLVLVPITQGLMGWKV